ncbi:MAG: alpha-E domain-containing protein, partial [Chloroflexota bacterium]
TQGRRLRRLLLSLDIDVPDVTELPDEEAVLRSLVFGTEDRTSLLQYLTSARENARQIREGISSEMWLQLNKLYLDVKQAEADDMWTQLPHRFLVQVREGSHLFQGLTDATMNHNQGWHFIQIGRYLERLIALVTFLNVQLQQGEDFRESDARNQYFELVTVLKSNSAFEAYCKVYNPDVQATRIVEFLLFNEQFPRSARFCVDTVLFSLDKLAEMTMRHKNQRVNRLAGRLQSLMNYDEIGDVLSGDFHDYLMNIKRQAYQIHESLYDAYITYKIESALK